MQISALLADSNSARAANGVGALAINGELNAAAQAQANDMAARNYWSHNTPEGQSPPWIWVTDSPRLCLSKARPKPGRWFFR